MGASLGGTGGAPSSLWLSYRCRERLSARSCVHATPLRGVSVRFRLHPATSGCIRLHLATTVPARPARVVPPSVSRTCPPLAWPHPASTPEHPGHANPPGPSRSSTAAGSVSTVSIAPPSATTRPSRSDPAKEHNGRAAAYPDPKIVTVATPINVTRPPPSASARPPLSASARPPARETESVTRRSPGATLYLVGHAESLRPPPYRSATSSTIRTSTYLYFPICCARICMAPQQASANCHNNKFYGPHISSVRAHSHVGRAESYDGEI